LAALARLQDHGVHGAVYLNAYAATSAFSGKAEAACFDRHFRVDPKAASSASAAAAVLRAHGAKSVAKSGFCVSFFINALAPNNNLKSRSYGLSLRGECFDSGGA
jgi:hypothetical protein